MAYLKINNTDFSNCVNSLQVEKNHTYNSQTNAAGNTVVDYIGSKRSFTIGIIPLDSDRMIALQNAIDGFSVLLSFRNPTTGTLEEGINCIIPANEVKYYTIQADNVLFDGFTIKLIEL